MSKFFIKKSKVFGVDKKKFVRDMRNFEFIDLRLVLVF